MESLILLLVFLGMAFVNGICLARVKGISKQIDDINTRLSGDTSVEVQKVLELLSNGS